MYNIVGNTFGEVYRKAILAVLNDGKEVSPRGKKTLELSPATIVINDPRKFLIMPEKRKGNTTFQLAEALWMLRGSNDIEEIAHYNKNWLNFEDKENPGILNGAYGERLRMWDGEIDQFYEVYKKLKKDPFSRQATMIIFDPERDNEVYEDGEYSKDIPCTNYFNFTIRDGKLNMWTVMRSNDLHKGTIYDIPTFIIFQHILAGWLDVEVGKYTHSAASLHIYESDVENFDEILEEEYVDIYKDKDLGDPRTSIEEFNETMTTIIILEHTSRETPTLEIFHEKIDAYTFWVNSIKNVWWKSVAAQIVMYNYRKLGATEAEFKQFLPFITNEYRPFVENLKQIGGTKQ